MKTFRIACTWMMSGIYWVEAENLQEAIDKVEFQEKPYDRLPEDQEYIDQSFNVDLNETNEFAEMDHENQD